MINEANSYLSSISLIKFIKYYKFGSYVMYNLQDLDKFTHFITRHDVISERKKTDNGHPG